MKRARLFVAMTIALLAAHVVTAPAARALGSLTRANLQVKRGAPHLDEREGSIDYPVVYTNTTKEVVAGPIHVVAPAGVKNVTTSDNRAKYVTLPTGLAPGQSFEQIFRFQAPPSGLASPDFTPFVENVGPLMARIAAAPGIVGSPPGEYRTASSNYPLRVRAVAGEEYVWDADATNPNGGTLHFSLAPIPNPTPDLASASYATGATVEPVTGIVRWTPPAVGFYTARLGVSDGRAVATSFYDFAFKVEPNDGVPITCTDYVASVQLGQTTPIRYTRSGDGPNTAAPNVVLAPGRTAACSLAVGTFLGEGKHPVTCQTTDGLWPKATCQFSAVVNRLVPPGTVTGTGAPGDPMVISMANTPNLVVDASECAAGPSGSVTSPCPPGYGAVNVRNTGFGVAHNVKITIPYPPEADRNAQLIRTGVNTTCQRDGKDQTSPLVCTLGDLAREGVIHVELAYAPKSNAPIFSPVRISVATSDAELLSNDDSVMFQPASPLSPLSTQSYIAQIKVPCDAACQKRKCLDFLPKKSSASNGFSALLGMGNKCEKPPKWFGYVVAGVFAAAAIVTGVGAVAIASYGAMESVVFTAGEAGGFIL